MTRRGAQARARRRALLVIENCPFPKDVRMRNVARELVGAGYEVTVVAPNAGSQPRREAVEGVRVLRFRAAPEPEGLAGMALAYLTTHLRLLGLCCRLLGRADVVHVANPPDTLFVITWLARLLRRRVVVDVHDLVPELFATRFPGRASLERLVRLFEACSVAAGHVVLCTSEAQRRRLAERHPRVAGALRLVRNAPPAAVLERSSEPSADAGAPVRVVYVGELAEQDGVLDLPRIMTSDRLDGVCLTVVGDGPAKAPMEAEAVRLGLGDRIEFTGWVPREEVFAHVARAHVCIDPAPCTAFNQTCAMVKIGEYLASGRPIVAYGLNETAALAGDAALLAECGDEPGFVDAIARLAADPELRARMGRTALARARTLTWERSAQELLAAYDAVAG